MAKIVTLGPVDSPKATISFEEVFGEFSEVRGRHHSRKSHRQESRAEREAARQSARQERKATISHKARKTRRQEARQEKRANRLENRQERKMKRLDIKDKRQQARQEHRDLRLNLKHKDEALEPGLDTPIAPEMNDQPTNAPMGADQGGYDSGTSENTQQGGADYGDQGGAEQGGYDSGAEQGGYDESGSYGDEGSFADYDRVGAGPQGSSQGGGVESSFPEDSMPYDETGSEGYNDGTDTGADYGEEDGYLQDYNESDDYGFDGVMGAEDRFSEMSDSGNARPKVKFDSRVQDITDKMAWNQELIKRLEAKRKTNPNQAQGISRQIVMRQQRMKELQDKLDAFSNCWGEYSSADGGSERTLQHRAMQVQHAKRRSHQKREMARRGHRVTPVQSNLNPSFGPNRIVVPGKSNFTGINGLDLANDFDAPRVREIQLGADGSQSSSKGLGWGAVIGAVAIGAVAFWIVEKYKLAK
jgi:hypothetical protein